MKTVFLMAAALMLAAGSAGAANLVGNGSFESPDVVGGDYVLYTSGSTAITDWTVLGPANDSVQLTPDTYAGLKASDGRQWLDLTGIRGYDKGVKSDVIGTVVGATYHLSFDIGNYVPFGKSTVGVSINGGVERLFTNTSLATTPDYPMNWASFGFDWVADSTSTQLNILGRANDALSNDGGIGLDAVRLELVNPPVPEPSAAAMLLGGLAVLGLLRRRRAA